jgi:hypothetical protein
MSNALAYRSQSVNCVAKSFITFALIKHYHCIRSAHFGATTISTTTFSNMTQLKVLVRDTLQKGQWAQPILNIIMLYTMLSVAMLNMEHF